MYLIFNRTGVVGAVLQKKKQFVYTSFNDFAMLFPEQVLLSLQLKN